MESKVILQLALKYILEGTAIAIAAYYIPKRIMSWKEIGMIALTGSVTFLLLDIFAPQVGSGARRGAGFGIGAPMVGYTGALVEPMEGEEVDDDSSEEEYEYEDDNRNEEQMYY